MAFPRARTQTLAEPAVETASATGPMAAVAGD
jgi:hypothetical protein